MNEQTEIFVNLLSEQVRRNSNETNQTQSEIEVDIFKRLCLCTLDIICGFFFLLIIKKLITKNICFFLIAETAMGQNVDIQQGKNSAYVQAVTRFFAQIYFSRVKFKLKFCDA